MELSYAELSSPGPVREINDDFVGFWQPETLEDRRTQGAVAALADGIGSPELGEVASRLAVETSISVFQESKGDLSTQQIMNRMFRAANLAVYEKEGKHERRDRRAATLCLATWVTRGSIW